MYVCIRLIFFFSSRNRQTRGALVTGVQTCALPISTNSYDPALAHRSEVGHTGQDASAAAIGGEALARCVLESGADGGTIIFPNTTNLGNVEVNHRIPAAFESTVTALNAPGKLTAFQVAAGPANIGVDVASKHIISAHNTLIAEWNPVVS